MARNILIFLIVGGVSLLLCPVSSADIPHMISYQGKLTTASGGCLNDTVEMIFSIYPDTLGSPADWSETQTEVVVKDGIFNVLLGSQDTIPSAVFDGNVKYLGVQVESDPEMRPLKPMVSVAYAYRAGAVDGGGGGGGWVDDGIIVRLQSSTDNVGIGTTGPAGKLDVTGQSVFRRGDGIQDKIILNPEDINVALELRSETSGGTPFIDFANDDASDFDARIRLREDGLLAVEGASDVNLQVDGQLRVDKELLVGSEPSEDLDATRSYYTYKGSAASPYTYQGSALRARITLGGNSTNPVGTGHGITSESVMLESGSSENEMTPLYLGCVAHEPCRLWGIDLSVHGPVSSQADLLQGLVNFVNNYNAASVPFKGVGTAIVTRPGAGGSATPEQQISQTYPLDAGLAIVGFSGTPNEAVKTQGFKTALQIGGTASGWMQTPLTSKLGTGVLVRDVETAGIKFQDFLNSTTPALSVDVPSVMEISEADSLKWKLSQEGSEVDAALLLRDMTEADEWWWSAFAGGDKRLSFQKDRMVVMRDGSVGIGTTTPTEKLQVDGTIHSTSGGFKFPDGTVQVTAAGGGGGGGWVDDGTLVRLETDTDSVGIGMTTPTEKLDVSGNIKATGTITSGSSITIDGVNDKIIATSGTIDFDDENLVTTGKAAIGPGSSNPGVNAFVAGENDTASGDWSTVGGGNLNNAIGDYSTIGGGRWNTADGERATVGGGGVNMASGAYSTVGGGQPNNARGRHSVVSGGGGPLTADTNSAIGDFSTIGGGRRNAASGTYSTIPGGRENEALGNYSFAAGRRAKANHTGTFVWTDSTDEDFASTAANQFLIRASGGVGIGTDSPGEELDVAGTVQMTGFKMPTDPGDGYVLTSDASGTGSWQPAAGGADDDWSFRVTDTADTTLVTGGPWGIARSGNELFGNADSTHVNLGVACTTGTSGQNYKYCTVGGGHGNTANGSYATVGGGYFNTAGNEYATVGGGVGNTASGYLATVGGGFSNTAANAKATVGGGDGDTASGNYSTVPGGRSNKAAGDYSLAAGRRAKANHSGSFVWADNTNEDFASTGDNQFLIRASGNVGIGTAAPAAQLDVAGTVQMTGFKMPTDPSDGYVLTSDGSGVGTWQPLAVAGDNDWSFRVTDTADTTLATAGAWGIARHGNTLYGTYDSTHVNLGVACITGNSGEDNKYCTVGGGGGNTAGGWSATVGGGLYNTANGFYSCVSGGNNNNVSHAYATVGGGRNNVVSADDATVSGGWGNTASGDNATVGGGYENTADYNYSTVGGGFSNTARYNYATVGGGIYNTAISVYATVGGGRADTASAAAATVGGGYHNIASGDSSTIGGGGNNTASGDAATVGGGTINAATADRAIVGGGMANLSGDTAATVGGGSYNKAWGKYSVVAGGGGGSASDSNSALGNWSAICGGKSNTVSNDYSIIGGGQLNTASGNYSSVGGGQSNEAGNTGTTVGGGLGNYASGYIATIGGGNNNTASGRWSTIAGGVSNTSSDTASAVGGGRNNKARGPYSVVAGGGGPTDSDSNSATGDWSTVSGGRSNTASGDHAAVGGGQGNWASTDHATIGGGKDNSAGNGYATVAGGVSNNIGGAYGTISGGAYNRIRYTCDYSAIPGGYADTLTLNADYSMGFGRAVYVDDGYHVMFFDGTWSGHLNLNRDHRDATPSSYPIRVGTHAFNGNGAYLTSGGVWTDISSRAKKEDFQQLDGDQVLDKIEAMSMTSWKFKGTEERHVGPVAEDFYRAFGCGTGIPEDDSTSIAALDLAGVSLVAVQELTRLIKEQQKEITALKAQIEALQTGRR